MIDTSQDFIEKGYARNVIVWILMAWPPAVKAIENDAPDSEKSAYLEQYSDFLSVLHFVNAVDFNRKTARALSLISDVKDFALSLIEDDNTGIR